MRESLFDGLRVVDCASRAAGRCDHHPGVVSGRRFSGMNVWPADLPGLREATLTYYDALDGLTSRLLGAVAVSLGLAPDHFDLAFVDNQSVLRLSPYPPAAAVRNQYGIAPHTDANFMTFVAQTPAAGLEVRMPSREWMPVPYLANSFAVNSGDMLHRWSNGRFKPTAHRVVLPEGVDRYAIAYILGPHRAETAPTEWYTGRSTGHEHG